MCTYSRPLAPRPRGKQHEGPPITRTGPAARGPVSIGPWLGPALALWGLFWFTPGPAHTADSWPRHTIDDSSRGADGVRLRDVNGDGLPDLATGWEEGGRIRIYLHPGPARVRQRWPAVTVGEVASPEDAVLVDLDQDGAADVVSCCEGRNRTIFFHWSPEPSRRLDPAQWRTEKVPATAGKQSWMFALPFDADGKHGIDLIVGAKGQRAAIGLLRSPVNPRNVEQWQFTRLYDAGWIMSLQAHDMDRDGDLDVVASDRKGPSRGVLWLENPGARHAERADHWRTHRIGPQDREVMFLTLTDWDGDRRTDVLCAVRGRGCTLLQRRGRAWQTSEIPIPPGSGTGKAVAVGDLDGNGVADLVFTCENARGTLRGVRWLSGDPPTQRPGARTRVHEISGPSGVKFDRIELLDLDQDGDLDVLTCEERDNLGVVWYENPR